MAKKAESKNVPTPPAEATAAAKPVAPAPVPTAPVEPAAEPAPAAPLDTLPVFIRKHEDAAARRGAERGEQIVVVAISHPAADESQAIYSGRDGGIRMSRGEPGAVYSDGSKHTAP